MTIEEIINKWRDEQDRLILKMSFCNEHNLPHEREFINQRYNAIGDVLADLRFSLDEDE